MQPDDRAAGPAKSCKPVRGEGLVLLLEPLACLEVFEDGQLIAAGEQDLEVHAANRAAPPFVVYAPALAGGFDVDQSSGCLDARGFAVDFVDVEGAGEVEGAEAAFSGTLA
ncbi:MAG TPA: hypothetical protein VFY54_19095 [Rubrobacter sp.]|nr:hypothetical protein [Rubrobacter sp.]